MKKFIILFREPDEENGTSDLYIRPENIISVSVESDQRGNITSLLLCVKEDGNTETYQFENEYASRSYQILAPFLKE